MKKLSKLVLILAFVLSTVASVGAASGLTFQYEKSLTDAFKSVSDGEYLVTVARGNTIRSYHLNNGSVISSEGATNNHFYAWPTTDGYIYSAYEGGYYTNRSDDRIFGNDVSLGFSDQPADRYDFNLNSSGRYAVTGSNGDLRVWKNDQVINSFADGRFSEMAFSTETKTVVEWGYDTYGEFTYFNGTQIRDINGGAWTTVDDTSIDRVDYYNGYYYFLGSNDYLVKVGATNGSEVSNKPINGAMSGRNDGIEIVNDVMYYVDNGAELVAYNLTSESEINTYSPSITDSFDHDLHATDSKLIWTRENDNDVRVYNLPNPAPKVDASINPSNPTFKEYIDVNYTATDSNGISSVNVSVYKEGSLIKSDVYSSSSQYLNDYYQINDINKNYTVNVTATDSLGAKGYNETQFFVRNNAPNINSFSTDPSNLVFNGDFDVSVNATDIETNVSNVTLEVYEGSNLIVNNLSLTDENNDDVFDDTKVFNSDEKNQFYNLTAYATDTNGKTSTSSLSKYLDDDDPVLKSYDFDPAPDNWIENSTVGLSTESTDDIAVENVSARVFRDGNLIKSETFLNEVKTGSHTINDLFTVGTLGGTYTVEIRVYDADNYVSTNVTETVTGRFPGMDSMTWTGSIEKSGSELPNNMVGVITAFMMIAAIVVILFELFSS